MNQNPNTTLNNGYLGSRNDAERSEMRYLVWIAGLSESSKFWTHIALMGNHEHACLRNGTNQHIDTLLYIFFIWGELWRRVTVLERFNSFCVSWNKVGMGFVKSFWFWTHKWRIWVWTRSACGFWFFQKVLVLFSLHHINSLSNQLWFLQTVMCQPLSSERSGVTPWKEW